MPYAMNYSICCCGYTHTCYTVVINARNELIISSLLGFVTGFLGCWSANCSDENYCFPVGFINEHPYGVYTVHNHTSGVRGCWSTT